MWLSTPKSVAPFGGREARLGPVDKAIVMQWLDERRYEEIADTMGMTAKNVSVRLVRIRERLAHWIREASTP